MNCLVVESDAGLVLIDCGVTFSHDGLGTDLIHPDFEYVWERADRLQAIVITHGHEDHIGGLPYLLRDVSAPIYAPAYAEALIEHRLADHGLQDVAALHRYGRGDSFQVGDLHFSPLAVHHSIVDAFALAIQTPVGTIVHSGDFKIEEDPVPGQLFERESFAALGQAGVRLLLSDSTNVHDPGRTGQEGVARRALRELIAQCPQRVVVGMFASNLFRVQSVMEAARHAGRKVCLMGRALHHHTQIARNLGYLKGVDDLLIDSDTAARTAPEKLLILATGTQGEPAAALSRLARDDHPALGVERGDRVILSSRIIPGNEVRVFDLIGDFERRGISVHDRRTDPDIHVSGHGAQEEQRALIQLLRPQTMIPTHGTPRHLHQHATVAQEEGVTETLVVEDGAVIEVTEDSVEVVDHAETGRVYLQHGIVVDPEARRERSQLARMGIAFIALPIDSSGQLNGTIRIEAYGIPDELFDPEEARAYVSEKLRTADTRSSDDLIELARRTLRRHLADESGRKPPVVAVAVEPS